MAQAQLSMAHVSKAFVRGKPVLDDVTLEVAVGEIRGLAGANGSGKSTLVKILAGYHAPDPGCSVSVAGKEVEVPIKPADVRRAGVCFVHQDLAFIGGMSVIDNMCLGRGYDVGPAGNIHWRSERRHLSEMLQLHRVDVDLQADAMSISVALRQKLAILRAIDSRRSKGLNVLVLDEATATMGADEASEFGDWLKEMARREHIAVLFVGHRPGELRQVTDNISVLRNGVLVATLPSAEVSNSEVVEAIVGQSLGSYYPVRRPRPREVQPLLEVRGLQGKVVRDVDLVLRRGEIVGLTGLQGSGFEEVPYLLFDPERRAGGQMVFSGEEGAVGGSIAGSVSKGMMLVPNDRARNSLATSLSVCENIVQPRLRVLRRLGLLRRRDERRAARIVVDSLGVVPADVEYRVGSLSGGNQQKVALGKWLSLHPKVLLLHEPTEGVDVGAKKDLFALLTDEAANGMAVVVASLEYEDLAHVCDRVLVFGRGRIIAEHDLRESRIDDVMRSAYEGDLSGQSEGVRWR